MKRFVEGMDRGQSTLFPECLEDWICEDNPVRVIDAFVEELDLAELKFCGVDPEATGRRASHPSMMLKLAGKLRCKFAEVRFSGSARDRSFTNRLKSKT